MGYLLPIIRCNVGVKAGFLSPYIQGTPVSATFVGFLDVPQNLILPHGEEGPSSLPLKTVELGICNFYANSIREVHDSKARGYSIYSFFLTSSLNCSKMAENRSSNCHFPLNPQTCFGQGRTQIKLQPRTEGLKTPHLMRRGKKIYPSG